MTTTPATDFEARLRDYLEAYSAKDIDAIAAMLTVDVRLQDWNLSVQGKEAVLAETRKNFAAAQSIAIEVLHVFPGTGSAAAELRIVVDGSIVLEVVDVLRFDPSGLITAIRAYK